MAVLTNDPDGPADLREKSLRLAAHLLEYDPQLRGGSGYARARELLDSGAALKKMQEIIDAQGPSTCRNDVGKLTFDVVAADDGTISEINCLQLNRLARTAGAPIDKGAGIRLFSKIGDRVEKGQPLYRIYAYDQSELDLAATAAKAELAVTPIGNPQPSSGGDGAVNAAIIQSLPSSSRDAARLAARLGIPFHEIAIHEFPDGEIRVTAGPAAPTTIIYASLDQPNEKLDRAVCSRPRRCGAEARSGSSCWRPISATCARTQPSTRAKRSARRSSAAACRMRRSRDHRRRAFASHAGHQSRISGNRVRQSLGYAGDRGRAAQRPVSIQQPSSSDRTRNRSPGSAISPAGSGSLIPSRHKTRRGDRSVEIEFPDPPALPAVPP